MPEKKFRMSEKKFLVIANLIQKTLKFIAAIFLVIANLFLVAIIIISLMTPHCDGCWSDPYQEAAMLVRQANTNSALLKISQTVVFKPQITISARAIALSSQTGLIENQICVSAGGFSESGIFEESNNKKTLTYTGTRVKDARIGAICDIGNALQKLIEENYEESGLIKSEWLDGCNCAQVNYEDTCCLVALISPTH